MATLELLTPTNGGIAQGSALDLRWRGPVGTDGYRVQIAQDERFEQVILDTEIPSTDSLTVLEMLPENGSSFYWRVQPQSKRQAHAWSSAFSFTSASSTAVQAAVSTTMTTARATVPVPMPAFDPESFDGPVPPYLTGTSSSGEAWAIVALMVVTSIVLAGLLLAIMS